MQRALTFHDIPALFRVLNKHDYTPVDTIGSAMLRCEQEGEFFVVKAATASESLMYTEVFPLIREQKLSFRYLRLPEAKAVLSMGRGLKILVLKEYEGETFNEMWSESRAGALGGRGLPDILAIQAVRMLADLQKIPVELVQKFQLLTFDTPRWQKENLPIILRDLKQIGGLSSDQSERFKEVLAGNRLFTNTVPILCNGDFYPRNFVRLNKTRVVLLDWEARTEKQNAGRKTTGMRNALIAPAELHVAFLSIHMWGNSRFRKKLHRAAVRSLSVSRESLRLALLVRALEQAHFWRAEESYLMHRLLDCAFEALENSQGI